MKIQLLIYAHFVILASLEKLLTKNVYVKAIIMRNPYQKPVNFAIAVYLDNLMRIHNAFARIIISKIPQPIIVYFVIILYLD
jgi:hypothetical protein